MGKIRRGGFLFVLWIGDHSPKHVHVFKDGKEIGKWNLEASVPMKGKFSKRVKKLIKQLKKEGRL